MEEPRDDGDAQIEAGEGWASGGCRQRKWEKGVRDGLGRGREEERAERWEGRVVGCGERRKGKENNKTLVGLGSIGPK